MSQKILEEEDSLLYLCTLPEKEKDSEQETIRLLGMVQNWDRLLQKACLHLIQSRLYSFLKRAGAPDLLEKEVWRKIEAVHRRGQYHVLALEAELFGHLLPQWEEMEIDVLLLKGAALNQTVYHEQGVRFFQDLDLLIHRQDWDRIQASLQRLGYQKPSLLSFPSRWHEHMMENRVNRNWAVFFHPEKKISVDLHREAFDDPTLVGLEEDWLWKDAEPVTLHGTKAFLPHPTPLFLHLLFHLAKHKGTEQNFWSWYLDLDACLRYFQSRIGESFCSQVIQNSPRQDPVLEILAQIGAHLSSPLPQEWRSLLQKKEVRPSPLNGIFSLSGKTELAAFHNSDWVDRREQFLSYWKQVPGLGNKIWFLLRWFFPDAEYFETKYPLEKAGKRWASYLWHFVTMAAKGLSLGLYCLRRRPSEKGVS